MPDRELQADMKALAEQTRSNYLALADKAYASGLIGEKEYRNFKKAVELGYTDPDIADDVQRLQKKVDLGMFNSTMERLSQL
jgi:hypothetical protein